MLQAGAPRWLGFVHDHVREVTTGERASVSGKREGENVTALSFSIFQRGKKTKLCGRQNFGFVGAVCKERNSLNPLYKNVLIQTNCSEFPLLQEQLVILPYPTFFKPLATLFGKLVILHYPTFFKLLHLSSLLCYIISPFKPSPLLLPF